MRLRKERERERERERNLTVSFTLPQSTMYTTSSMVMLVSAMLVAITIFRTPSGGRSNICERRETFGSLTYNVCFNSCSY